MDDARSLELKRPFGRHCTPEDPIFVRTSDHDLMAWDRQRIVDALLRETSLDRDTADAVSREVEASIVGSGINAATASLIREMVNVKLAERGLERPRRLHSRLGMPLADVERMIVTPRECGIVHADPEATDRALADAIKEEYAVLNVYAEDVVDAHARGDIHVTAFGRIDRMHSMRQGVEFVKRFGPSMPGGPITARPARRADVLVSHLAECTGSLALHVTAGISWDAVDIGFAPYIAGMADAEVRQLAQMLLFEISRHSTAAQIGLRWTLSATESVAAVTGPGGQAAAARAGEMMHDARRFAEALLREYGVGDGEGRPFGLVTPVVSFDPVAGDNDRILEAVTAAAVRYPVVIELMQPDTTPASLGIADRDEAPFDRRSAVVQQVALNLPRLAIAARGSDARLFEALDSVVEMAARAHRQKRLFIERLLSRGDEGSLGFLTAKRGGVPLLQPHRTRCVMAVTGLDELVREHTGMSMRDSDDAVVFGSSVVSRLRARCEQLAREYNMQFVTGAAGGIAARRFARLDLRFHAERASQLVGGTPETGDITYHGGCSVDPGADPLRAVAVEAALQQLLDERDGCRLPLPAGMLTSSWICDIVASTRCRRLSLTTI